MSVFGTKKKSFWHFLHKEAQIDRDVFREAIEEFEKTCVVSKPTKPNIIARSNILITKCERCKSVYQAGWEHTRSKAKPGVELLIPENLDFVTECPCCGWFNIVEFEEGEIK